MTTENQTPPAAAQPLQTGGVQPQPNPNPPQTGEPPAPKPQGPDFKALLQRDRELRQAAEAMKAKEGVLREADELLALAKGDPIAFLQKQGVDYNEWTRKVLAGQKGDPNAPIKSELQKIQEQLAADRAERERSYIQQQEAMDRQYVSQYVESGDYPLVKAAKASGLVYDQIQSHYRRTGQYISEEEAANAVEGYLMGLVKTLSGVDKVKEVFAPQPSQPDVTQQQVSSGRPGTTLSNQHTATVPSRQDPNGQLLSFEDSLAKAASMIRWKQSE